MVQSTTPRLGLPTWSSDADNHPGRPGTNSTHQILENLVSVWAGKGLLSARPAAGVEGRFWVSTNQGDGGRLSVDLGDKWLDMSTLGGGGPGQAVVVGGVGAEGVSSRGARSDHTHPLPLATWENHGALASQDKELLDSASVSGDAYSLAMRDGSGRLMLGADPVDALHAATRRYADGVGEPGNVGSSVVRRWSSGQISISDPSALEHGATKRYVDNKTWDGHDLNQWGNDVWWEIISGSTSAYNSPQSGSVYTVSVNSAGKFMRFTSKRADKDNITPLDVDPRRLLSVETVAYQRRDSETGQVPEGARVEWGVIADDELDRVPELVLTETDPETGETRAEGWDVPGQVAAHQHLLKWATGRVDAQERRIAKLEDTVRDLVRIVNDLTDDGAA